MDEKRRRRILIMGAAGRDFHNFLVVYRDDPAVDVVAFTATQIPGIADRRFPPALAGSQYPRGIPIVDEADLEQTCRREKVDRVVFAYSDLPHRRVMHLASRALAAGADFVILGPESTMLPADVPVIAVSAVRTGCGKSQTTRWLSGLLRKRGLRCGVIRHPMPYGNLERQRVQRFASRADLDAADCTIEEREEYEPHLELGNVVYAGVDYASIVEQAQAEADLLLWDGGNNDFPFLRPDLHLVLLDPLRPGHETSHHPGEAVLRMADILVVTKVDAAADADVQSVVENARRVNPDAPIVRAASPVTLDDPKTVAGRRVLVVEDGPSITHGDMAYGAGYVAAVRSGASEILDPRDFAVPSIASVYAQYPHIGRVLPAVGYGSEQVEALRETIARSQADVVVAATPIDLSGLLGIRIPVVRARYEFAEAEDPGLEARLQSFLDRQGLGG
jgi:predicted GTPase